MAERPVKKKQANINKEFQIPRAAIIPVELTGACGVRREIEFRDSAPRFDPSDG
jgi:hypothetical protein